MSSHPVKVGDVYIDLDRDIIFLISSLTNSGEAAPGLFDEVYGYALKPTYFNRKKPMYVGLLGRGGKFGYKTRYRFLRRVTEAELAWLISFKSVGHP